MIARLIVGAILLVVGLYFIRRAKNKYKIKSSYPSTNGLEEVLKND